MYHDRSNKFTCHSTTELLPPKTYLKALWIANNMWIYLRMPPGPTGIPFLGNVLQTTQESFLQDLSKWRRQYGDIFKISFFGKEYMVVSALQIILKIITLNTKSFWLFAKLKLYYYMIVCTSKQQNVSDFSKTRGCPPTNCCCFLPFQVSLLSWYLESSVPFDISENLWYFHVFYIMLTKFFRQFSKNFLVN